MACGAAISDAASLCGACWRQMRFIEKPYCPRLGTPFVQDFGEGLVSPEAIARPPAFRRARAVVRFADGPERLLVHRLKYGDRTEYAGPMGRWMARSGAELLADADLVVPVPLHRLRLFKRRFNQAAALAQVVAREARLRYEPLLIERIKSTATQVGMSRRQRQDNMQGAFRVPAAARPAVEGRTVLLVDDVLTTGATLNAATTALLRAGAAHVDVLTFARVVTDA